MKFFRLARFSRFRYVAHLEHSEIRETYCLEQTNLSEKPASVQKSNLFMQQSFANN